MSAATPAAPVSNPPVATTSAPKPTEGAPAPIQAAPMAPATPPAVEKPAAGESVGVAKPATTKLVAGPGGGLTAVKPEAPKPVAPPASADYAVVVPPGASLESPEESTGFYYVGLKDNPTIVIAATDRYDAIERYKKHCGIISTINEFGCFNAPKPG